MTGFLSFDSCRLKYVLRFTKDNLYRACIAQSVSWPLLSETIEETVIKYFTCAELPPETRELLIPSSLPDRSWEGEGTDVFELDGKKYIIVIDYLSRWIVAIPLHQTMYQAILSAFNSVFRQHG